jgi:hypothetical protein
MSTPTWIRFSTVTKTPQQILEDASGLFGQHKLQTRELARLALSDEGTLEFDEPSLIKIRGEEEALSRSRKWDGFAIAYNVASITAVLYVYFWSLGEAYGAAVQTDTQIPFLERDDLAEGEWLERFLSAYTAITSASASGYGQPYRFTFDPLDPDTIARELRDGTMVRRKFPSLHMISNTLVTDDEVAAALALEGKNPLIRHFRTTTGYHVISSISRANPSRLGSG